MKNLIVIASIVSVALISSCSQKQDTKTTSQTAEAVTIQPQVEPDTLKGSLKARASNNVNGVNVTISYHSPAVRGRIVWGGLVPYEKVWVGGAHMATSLDIDQSIRYDGKEIPAGKYALFTIPGKETWTVIINKNWQQHLTDEYDEKDDLIRLQVVPENIETNQERLMYQVDQTGEGKFSLIFSWEKIKIKIPFELN